MSTTSTTPTGFLRRNLTGILGAAVLAATVLGSTRTAGAETPPPPPAGPVLQAAPGPLVPDLPVATVGPNTNWANDLKWAMGDTWGELTFTSTAKSVIAQFSTNQPTLVNGRLSMGAAQPVALSGTPLGGGKYGFKMTPGALTPATTYHLLINVPGNAGQAPNQVTSFTATKVRNIRMTPISLHVIDDGDAGVKGAGEIRFGFRVAPDADPWGAGVFGSWTGEMKLHSGDDVNLWGSGHGHSTTTRLNSAVVQVQGHENDVFGPGDWSCGSGTPPPHVAVPLSQGSNSCYDSAHAAGQVQLPTGPYQGTWSKVVDVNVGRSPALRFSGKVLVEVWYS